MAFGALLGAIPAPLYTPSSIVNAANPQAAPLAPNTIATLYGKDLSYTSKAVTAGEIRGGILPTVLIGTGVRVIVNNIQANLYYVSPGQINFLVPMIGPGPAEIRVSLDGAYGPAVRVNATEFAPALFQADPEFLIATRPDASVITRDTPAKAGEIVTLYATGLGATRPRFLSGEVPTRAATIERLSDFRVLMGSNQLAPTGILYAGVAPGFAGLYQLNVRVPGEIEPNPPVRIGFGEALSPDNVRLHAIGSNLQAN